MKFGVADYGMNVWEGGCYDLTQRLEELRSIGLQGTERLEVCDAADAVNKAALYRRMGMDFATCRCANQVSLSIEFTAALGKEYVWFSCGPADRQVDFSVYCRRAHKYVQACSNYGLQAVLHNHLGSRIESQQELEDFLDQVPGACLLLDIGHLAGAGGDNQEIIRKYPQRIASIHFKDVFIKDSALGLDRWGERLRFCELGAGNAGIDFNAICSELKKIRYDKWVLIEHDTHLREPLVDLKISLDILKNLLG
ncbi:MAG TPA: sugar phosphate isomerase/epimerase [Syntrophomonas sp.]|nr:sugar phosphate isomerase/epimerase [Syntrophomonas sp.]